jgi:hypothetical protein
MRRLYPASLLLLVGAAAFGCGLEAPTGPDPEIPEADLRVLFVGNSLTATNSLPGLVALLAEEAGLSFAWDAVVRPGSSLADHWNQGLEGAIRAAGADVVVLQQGPSTLPQNQEHLAHWAGVIAPVVREAGGEPALLMVWPSERRAAFFPDAYASYADAAREVDGIFIPAGQTWVEAWRLDPTLDFYGPDRFHPSYLGTLAAAHTVLAVLYDLDPADIPPLDDGLADSVRITLRDALRASFERRAAAARDSAPGSQLPDLPSIRPGLSPVNAPSETTAVPFTSTWTMPRASWWGSVKVAGLSMVSRSKTTRSAIAPSRITPRSSIRQTRAGSDVMLRIA